jgi:hypothetical protein
LHATLQRLCAALVSRGVSDAARISKSGKRSRSRDVRIEPDFDLSRRFELEVVANLFVQFAIAAGSGDEVGQPLARGMEP